MHRSMAFTACLGLGLISAAAAWADTGRPSPQVLVLGQQAGARAAPTILRGSAVQPKAATATADHREIVAGRQLWVVDRDTGEVQSCINRQTSSVGVRAVRCTTADLGDYSRTFGPNFKP